MRKALEDSSMRIGMPAITGQWFPQPWHKNDSPRECSCDRQCGQMSRSFTCVVIFIAPTSKLPTGSDPAQIGPADPDTASSLCPSMFLGTNVLPRPSYQCGVQEKIQ